MTANPYSKAICLLSGFLLLAAAGVSQMAAQEADEETIYELSPFTVEEGSEIGYQATTTLAGSRLNTPLRNVGAPISVVTEELFDDLGATDAASILAYTASMEVTGVQGNFAGGVQGAQVYSTENQRTQPQSEGQRVRGLAKASITRGYFLTDIPFDSYNTSRVTISRGPNSLLFGIGEVGGIIDNAVKQALTAESFGEIGVRVGERGSHRETLDYNFAIVPNRIGIRVAALNESTEFEQRPTYEDSERWYVALNAVLFENENSDFLGATTLKANYENGEIVSNPPNIIPPTDGLSPWFSLPPYSPADVRSLYDGTIPNRLAWIENGEFVPKLTVDNRMGEFRALNIPNSGRQPWFFNLPVIYNDPKAQVASVGFPDASIQGIWGRAQYQLLKPRLECCPGQIDFLSVQPIEVDNLPGFVAPVIQDRNVLDNTKLNIAGPTGRVSQDFDAQNMSLEQVFADGRGGIQIAYDKQNYENQSQLLYDSGPNNYIWIDINTHYGNLQPNPNLGRPFMLAHGNQSDFNIRTRNTEREAKQATAFYKLDFEDILDNGLGKWIGRHTITGFLGDQEIDRQNVDRQPNWADVPGSGTDIRSIQGSRIRGGRLRVMITNYIGPSLLGPEFQSLSDVRFTDYIENPIPQNGDRYKLVYSHFRDPQINPADGTVAFEDEFEVYYALGGGDHTLQEIESEVLSWQGELLDGHLVALWGWRTDKSKTFPSPGNNILPSGEWDINNLALDLANPSITDGDTETKSLVVHVPRSWTEALPFDVSFHYSESENFLAVPARNDIQRNPLGNPTGATEDYGVTFEVLENRLSLRLNKFETSALGINAEGLPVSALAGGWIRTMLARTFENSLTLTIEEFLANPGQPADGPGRYNSYQEMYDDILNLSLAKSHGNQYLLDTNDPAFGRWETPVDRATATTSFVAEGYEAELVGNITENWRVYLNVSKQETVQSNTATLMGEVGFRLRDEIAATNLPGLLDSASRNEPFTYDGRLVRNVLNPLSAALAKDGTISQEQRKWRWNFVTNYQFTEGMLKGFEIGGALRWQDKAAVGYRTLSVVEGAVTPDLSNPFFDDSQFNGDLGISYNRPILENKVNWKVQLNVLNIIRDSDYIPVSINPDGRVAVMRNPPPVDIFMSNTFSF